MLHYISDKAMPAALDSSPNHGWNAHAGDPDAQASLYLDMIAGSTYADALVPALDTRFHDVLDVGAGGGTLTRRCLVDGGQWTAVEPNRTMGRALAEAALALRARRIRFTHLPCTWEALPDGVVADTVLAANIGAAHHTAEVLFSALAPRARREMIWIVAAQEGPSTFCLAGMLPPELHLADTTPAYLRTLAQLGPGRAPQEIAFADWECRMHFSSTAAALDHFLSRLDTPRDSARGQAIDRHLLSLLTPSTDGVLARCPKRSAILRWTF